MVLLKRGSKMGSLLVFSACAFITWSAAVSTTWLMQRGLRSGRGVDRSFPTIAAQTSTPQTLAAQLQDQFLSGEECAAVVAGRSAADIWELLRNFEVAFWQRNPNAAPLLRQAARSLGKEASAEMVVNELSTLFQQRGLDAIQGRRLLTVAFAGLLEAHSLPEQELVTLLRKVDDANALSLLEMWLDFQKPGSPQADLDTALRIAAQYRPQMDDRFKDDLTTMVVRIWGHRAPPLADALLFATKFERSRVHDRLLLEGSRVLAVANPDEMQRRMIQFAPVMAKDAGMMAANAGISLPRAFAMAKQMQAKEANEFLRYYLDSSSAGDPREMSKVADSFLAKDLPEAAAQLVAHGLMKGSDRVRINDWLEGLSIEAQAKMWDATVHPFDPLDASAARYYLEKRPREVPPNAWVMRSVLDVLPYEEAVQALPLAGQLDNQLRIQIPQEMARNRIQKLLTEDPDRIPEFLATVPSEVRQGAIREALGGWADPDPQMMQKWIQRVDDPQMKAELESRLLENGAEHGSLADVEAHTLQLINTGASPDTSKALVNKILSMERDSRQASAFIQQLPSGEIRDQAILSFAKRWATLDPVAASEWLADLPAGRGRDLATRELISAARDDPERALANAAAIDDPELRFTAARTVLRVWRDADPARAEALVRAAGFSPEETTMLQALLGIRTVEVVK